MTKRLGLMMLVLGLAVNSAPVRAQIPRTISYQGLLTDGAGNAVADTTHSLTLRLYTQSSGSSALWTESQVVTTSRGIFSVVLGTGSPLALAFDREYWLGVSVDGGGELSPRIRLTGTPYSLNAKGLEDSALVGRMVGNGQFVRRINGLTDAVVLAAGGNISIATSGDTLRFSGAAGALALPFSSSISDPGCAISVTNTGTGSAGCFMGHGPNQGEFPPCSDPALSGIADGGSTCVGVYGRVNQGASSPASGVMGETTTSGYGVMGVTGAQGASGVFGYTTNPTGYGGWFKNYAGGRALQVDGTARVGVLEVSGADVAERFAIAGEDVRMGMTVVIDPDRPGGLRVSSQALDRKVAGVISGAGGINPGMELGQAGTLADGDWKVGVTGRVYCWCDATENPIEPGDLLTTSATPGHARKLLHSDFARAQGAVIGKAMTRLRSGRGLVLVLLGLQ